jgi:hypothetical protein
VETQPGELAQPTLASNNLDGVDALRAGWNIRALPYRHRQAVSAAQLITVVRQPMVPLKDCASFYEMKIYRGLGIKIR